MKRVFFALVFFHCAQKLPQGGQRVEGRVVLLGAPDFSGAHVAIDGAGDEVTGSFGDFAFDGVLPGAHVVSARSDAQTLEEEVAVPIVVNDDMVSGLQLQLTEVAEATGSVSDSSGAPIAGARVFAAGTAAVAFSVADGSFTLARIPAGTRTLVASAQGYLPQTLNNVALQPSATPVAVSFSLATDNAPPSLADNHPPVIGNFTFAPSPPPRNGPQPIPVISQAAPDLVHAGAAITLTVTASDPDGDSLTYLWSADKGQLNGSTGPVAEWVPTNEAAEVVVIVVDTHGGAASVRHDFLPPPKSIRGGTLYGDQVIYSEGRTGSRDIVSFDLVARTETTIDAGAEEQSSPRVSGDYLAYADQVFTLVQPTIFQVHVRGLQNGFDALYGVDLAPDGFIDMDFNLDTALTGATTTYSSDAEGVTPVGIGAFDITTQKFASTQEWQLGTDTPAYPCFVALDAQAFAVVGAELHVYSASAAPVNAAALPASGCIEMQAAADWVAIRQSLPQATLTLVNWRTGEVRAIGAEVDSFVLHGTTLAYADFRTGFSGVYLYDVSSGAGSAVPLSGPQIRRVLELSDSWLVYGEQQQIGSASSLSSDSIWAFPR